MRRRARSSDRTRPTCTSRSRPRDLRGSLARLIMPDSRPFRDGKRFSEPRLKRRRPRRAPGHRSRRPPGRARPPGPDPRGSLHGGCCAGNRVRIRISRLMQRVSTIVHAVPASGRRAPSSQPVWRGVPPCLRRLPVKIGQRAISHCSVRSRSMPAAVLSLSVASSWCRHRTPRWPIQRQVR